MSNSINANSGLGSVSLVNKKSVDTTAINQQVLQPLVIAKADNLNKGDMLVRSQVLEQKQLSSVSLKDNQLILDNGQKFIMKGINLTNNVYGNWDNDKSPSLKSAGKDPLIRALVQDSWVLQDPDFKNIKNLNVNVVRYCFNHELFDKSNPQRDKNLAKMVSHVQKFKSMGIYTILNLHLPKGMDVQNLSFERKLPGDSRMATVFESEDYWASTVELWSFLARAFKDDSSVMAYELFNEPTLPSEQDGGKIGMQQKYQELVNTIRDIDTKHIIIVCENETVELSNDFQDVKYEANVVKEEFFKLDKSANAWETPFKEVNSF